MGVMRAFLPFSVVFMFSALLSALNAEEHKEDISHYLSEILPLSWKHLREEYNKGLSIEMTSYYDDGPPEKLRILYDNGCEMVTSDFINDEYHNIEILNPRYTFEIARNHSEGSAYYIKSLDKKPSSFQFFHGHLSAMTDIFAAFYIEDSELEKLIESPGFQIKSTDSYLTNGGECIAVEFNANHDSDRFNRITNGRIVFNKDLGNVIQEYQIDSVFRGEKYTDSREIEYQMIGDLPYPKKIKTTFFYPNGRTSVLTQEFQVLPFVEPENESFYLSHYKLPEPTDELLAGGENIPKTRIVFLIIGFILVAAGILGKRNRIKKLFR